MAVHVLRTCVIFAACMAMAGPQQSVPVRQMAPPSATASDSFGFIFGVHQFADGRVLVDDGTARRLLLFDASLSKFSVVADTTPGTASNYGCCASAILDYLGDTALLVNFETRGLLVIDPKGSIVRAMALPKTTDYLRISGARTVVDTKGRLVYRGVYPPVRSANGRGAGTYVTQAVDSAPLVRADFDTRTVDTIGSLKLPVLQKTIRTVDASGGMSERVIITPLAWADDWIVTSDGSVAIVRGQDYHIDWLRLDGTRTASPKLPFDWLRIPDEEKLRLGDSARAAVQKTFDEVKARSAKSARPVPPGTTQFVGMMNTADGTSMSLSYDAKIESAPLNDILDFQPPIRAGVVKADFEGNIWILPNTVKKTAGGIVYDVINARGELFERVQLLADRSIAGFGPGGVVYLMWKAASGGWHLERSRVAQ